MPCASRHFLPGHVWHITHRCHQRKFLLKFARDRRRYLHWVFEARKRLGLSVLNYTVTSNHIHLLVNDTGPNGNVTQVKELASESRDAFPQGADCELHSHRPKNCPQAFQLRIPFWRQRPVEGIGVQLRPPGEFLNAPESFGHTA
jgi:REP element-mobilizing transposase RayT